MNVTCPFLLEINLDESNEEYRINSMHFSFDRKLKN